MYVHEEKKRKREKKLKSMLRSKFQITVRIADSFELACQYIRKTLKATYMYIQHFSFIFFSMLYWVHAQRNISYVWYVHALHTYI